MKISIFPKAKAHPRSPEEKRLNSFKVSNPYKPKTLEFNTTDELIDIITTNTWSPFVFKEYRLKSDFISTDFIAFDIDQGMRIEESEKIVHKLDLICLCLPSTSFSEEKHKFRLIFPLSRTIHNVDIFKSTYAELAKYFPVDPQCKDEARFYYGSTLKSGYIYTEGKLLEPVVAQKVVKQDLRRFAHKDNVEVGESIEELVEHLYGEKRTKIPDNMAYFLEHAPSGLDGEMYARGNSFLFTCGLLGLDQERVEAVFEKVYPYEITTHVEYMVDKIYNEGYTAREEL